jgi:hypothetical protein
VLEGRVVRAAPFGVFVDVGLGNDALIPVPHIGDRPGLDPATIAPVGAVVQARVLEVDVPKRRLTLTMRPERFDYGGPPRGDRGDRGPRGGRRPDDRHPDARRPEGARGGGRPDDRRPGRGRRPEPSEGRPRPEPVETGAEAKAPDAPPKPAKPSKGPAKKGKFQVQELGLFDRRKFRDEPGTPRRISLKSEDLTPEQRLAQQLLERLKGKES